MYVRITSYIHIYVDVYHSVNCNSMAQPGSVRVSQNGISAKRDVQEVA
jgi:hypothetical protein